MQVLADAFESKEKEAAEIGAKREGLEARMAAMEDELIRLAEAQDKAEKVGVVCVCVCVERSHHV